MDAHHEPGALDALIQDGLAMQVGMTPLLNIIFSLFYAVLGCKTYVISTVYLLRTSNARVILISSLPVDVICRSLRFKYSN
jgi:hypothetical protein